MQLLIAEKSAHPQVLFPRAIIMKGHYSENISFFMVRLGLGVKPHFFFSLLKNVSLPAQKVSYMLKNAFMPKKNTFVLLKLLSPC